MRQDYHVNKHPKCMRSIAMKPQLATQLSSAHVEHLLLDHRGASKRWLRCNRGSQTLFGNHRC